MIYFLKEKYEAFYIFLKFKSMVKKENYCYILILIIDRGDKFASNDFNRLYKNHSIKR